jgi:hypothetical protein
LLLAGGSLFSLSSKANETRPYAASVKFNASDNPSTVEQRATVFTNATIDITYSDKSVKTAQALTFVELFGTGDVLKKPPAAGGGSVIAAGYTRPDGVTPLTGYRWQANVTSRLCGRSVLDQASQALRAWR